MTITDAAMAVSYTHLDVYKRQEYVKDSERMSRGEYEYQKSLKEVMLADAEYCMSNAENMDEFIWNLKELGYEVKQGKHIAIKAGGMKKFRRVDTLDESC